MPRTKRKQGDLFKLIYGIGNNFYVPYQGNTTFKISDHEVVNYPIIKASWLQRQALLLSMTMKLQGDENSEEYKIIREYLNNYWDDVERLIAYLQEAVIWGVSVVEMVWDAETLFPTQFYPIPRNVVVFQNDKWYVRDIEITPHKFILCQNTPTADQPLGFALITALRPLYAMVKNIYGYWGQYVRTYANPSIVFEIDTNAIQGLTDEEKSRIMAEIQKLKNLDVYQNLILSQGFVKWSIIEPKTTNTDTFKGLLDEIHRQMILLILGQELTTQAQTSSYALGKVHYQILTHIVERDARLIANAINSQLIPAILELKGIKVKRYPYVEFSFPVQLSLDDILKLSQIIPLDRKDINKLTGLDL